jgi:tetratricopeptide (TPR) repeat protein
VFAEESYGIASAGEFWLEALYRLGDHEADGKWKQAYERVRQSHDENQLRQAAIDGLVAFSKVSMRRLILVIENLNTLVTEQLDIPDLTQIVDVLSSTPTFMLLGTATAPFYSNDLERTGWTKLFGSITLDPLTEDQSRVLWNAITGEEPGNEQLRPIQILTGGNPRFIRILADFARKRSFRALLDDLINLIDEHTEYFKAQLDSLSPLERKVFAAVLELWNPSSAREIATFARLDVPKTSSVLSRLERSGSVMSVGNSIPKLFQAAERLYNIYYLMRRKGVATSRVNLAVRFMVQFYRDDSLVETFARIAEEACKVAPEARTDYRLAFVEMANCGISPEIKLRILKRTPNEFLNDLPDSIKELRSANEYHESVRMIRQAEELYASGGSAEEIDGLFLSAIAADPIPEHARGHFARLLETQGRIDEAQREYELALKHAPKDRQLWTRYARLLWLRGEGDRARTILANILGSPNLSPAICNEIADLYHEVGLYGEAVGACKRGVTLAKGKLAAELWYKLAELYHYHLEKPEEAATAYQSGIKEDPKEIWLYYQYGRLLADKLRDTQQAKHYWEIAEEIGRKQITRKKTGPASFVTLAQILEGTERLDAAESLLREGIEKFPKCPELLSELGQLLRNRGRYAEAVDLFERALISAPCNVDIAVEAAETYLRTKEPSRAKQVLTAVIKSHHYRGGQARYLLFLAELELKESVQSVLAAANAYLVGLSHSGRSLNEVAWALYLSGRNDLLGAAQDFALKAVAENSDSHWIAVHTLASIMGRRNEWSDALAMSSAFVSAAKDSDIALRGTMDFLIEAAAVGYVDEVLRIVESSPSRAALEPLIVGLKLAKGESPVVAQEISEIARDVSGKIAELKRKKGAEKEESLTL